MTFITFEIDQTIHLQELVYKQVMLGSMKLRRGNIKIKTGKAFNLQTPL
ncbi:MAG: hypothetical protein IPQ03_17375 [Bacteroidetes bacterium]|nr:hypothetical protein [Bacteroidota bacterium]